MPVSSTVHLSISSISKLEWQCKPPIVVKLLSFACDRLLWITLCRQVSFKERMNNSIVRDRSSDSKASPRHLSHIAADSDAMTRRPSSSNRWRPSAQQHRRHMVACTPFVCCQRRHRCAHQLMPSTHNATASDTQRSNCCVRATGPFRCKLRSRLDCLPVGSGKRYQSGALVSNCDSGGSHLLTKLARASI